MNAPLRMELLELAHQSRRFYLPVRIKFVLALIVAISWTGFSVYLAQAWMHDLAKLTHPLFAIWALTFIAFVPGFMNAFLGPRCCSTEGPSGGCRYSIPQSAS